MSIFFHIDVNSAFLSWSAIRKLNNGSDIDLREIPSIIGGDTKTRHGIVLAKSIPAKKYGISTAEPIVSALRKCPTLMIEPPDHAYYEEQSKLLMDYLRELSPRIEQVSIDECYMDFTPIAKDYPSPEIAAHMIKDEVKARFGFTVNVGISDRKVLAKMASDFKKPDLVHTLYHDEIEKKMWPLPISSLYMCGKSSVDALKKLEILTIGDLAKADPS
ncbi:MAG: DNA polymerase IV, partial [Lachnospiraceae bacterium]|nr:DNA polymerase IV [Lachnospiraceae bacterium]